MENSFSLFIGRTFFALPFFARSWEVMRRSFRSMPMRFRLSQRIKCPSSASGKWSFFLLVLVILLMHLWLSSPLVQIPFKRPFQLKKRTTEKKKNIHLACFVKCKEDSKMAVEAFFLFGFFFFFSPFFVIFLDRHFCPPAFLLPPFPLLFPLSSLPAIHYAYQTGPFCSYAFSFRLVPEKVSFFFFCIPNLPSSDLNPRV